MWRSLHRLDLYDQARIAPERDARLLFNMVDDYASCGDEQKDVFSEVVEDLLDRSNSFVGVSVPDNYKLDDHMLMDRKFGIRQNLPREKVFEIKGHVCVPLIGVLRHTFAHKICTGFAKETDINRSPRNKTWANGCAAMDALLEHTKKQNTGNLPTKHSAFVLWLDGFVRSWIKQRGKTCGYSR